MALLLVPVLSKEHTSTYTHMPTSPSLSSNGAAAAGTSYCSLKLFLPTNKPFHSRTSKLLVACIADVERASQQRRTQISRESKGRRGIRGSPPSWKSSHGRRDPAPFHRGESYADRSRNVDGEGYQIAENSSRNFTEHSAMARIIEKLRSIQETFDSANRADDQDSSLDGVSSRAQIGAHVDEGSLRMRTAGELFLPKPNTNIFSVGNYWSTPDHPVPTPGRGVPDLKFPWEFNEQAKHEEEEEKKKRVKPPTLAEVLIPPHVLRRLRSEGIPLSSPVKVGRLGITDNIADNIIGRWRSCELVKVKCGGPAAANMLKIHKDLERKTGGLVIWRAGSVAVIYRGSDYDVTNRTVTSLEKKLEGLISSKYLDGYSETKVHHNNRMNEENGLCKATPGSEINSEGIGHNLILPDNIQDDDNTIHAGSIPSEGSMSPYAKRDGNATCVIHETRGTVDAIQILSQAMETRIQESDFVAPQNAVVDIARRLNITPDPFVDRDYATEIDGILEGLGPRCEGWAGLKPAPVDADLLPPLIPNYRPPYRLLPYGVRPQLNNQEQTDLRRLIRHIPPHFALGRNSGLQGLSDAILKLWERSEVAKIAIKRGVQNTSSEKMAEELKRCTGGVLLSRDRYYITLYRGKDFLPREIAFALTERTSTLRNLKPGEESILNDPTTEEALEQKLEKDRVKAEAEKARRAKMALELEKKLAMAIEKKDKAERDIGKLDACIVANNQPAESEALTEEERYMFRKLGLKMRAFLLIGRRGVFDGVVENMHLHWKYRELVKLIVKERDPVELQKAARLLEYESGGVLIAVVGTSKGQAIIMYRGKNYQRPELLRPQNLLNKKKALERSVEIQRRSSLSRQISALEEEISKLKSSLSDAEKVQDEFLQVASGDLSCSPGDLKSNDILEDDKHLTAGRRIDSIVGDEVQTQTVRRGDKRELLKLVEQGPIFRAHRLSNLERLKLRKLALKLGVGARFNVGKSNVLLGLARTIRVHYLRHALVVIGVKNRGRGTSVQEIINELEDLTGGVLVSQEQNHIIMYRGWPKGEKMPTSGTVEEVSPELIAALEADEEDMDLVHYKSFMAEESDSDDCSDDELLLADQGEAVAEEGDDSSEFLNLREVKTEA